ncbi:hypothetical protein BaRGS_00007636 [Batillaria attramentaria]|uniref:Uncharacterized protein n=1 Tax=Batillaria attramentaria TaxID=370345 RepID=A0ABD0LPS5_9CAEN
MHHYTKKSWVRSLQVSVIPKRLLSHPEWCGRFRMSQNLRYAGVPADQMVVTAVQCMSEPQKSYFWAGWVTAVESQSCCARRPALMK